MKNSFINRETTVKVARVLGELNDVVVYVGGAMVSLYIDDPAAEDIRPTKDIDLTFEVASYAKLEALREELYNRGFTQSAEDKVNCRFRFEDLKVDVMATKAVGWAPSNRWFKLGFDKAYPVEIDDTVINVLPLSYFLATKLEAFFDRGMKDIYKSHDLEDIVYLFNYTTTIDDIIIQSDTEVKSFIKESLIALLKDQEITSAVLGCLYYEQADERMEIIQERMENIIASI